jgi:hypothetical protein
MVHLVHDEALSTVSLAYLLASREKAGKLADVVAGNGQARLVSADFRNERAQQLDSFEILLIELVHVLDPKLFGVDETPRQLPGLQFAHVTIEIRVLRSLGFQKFLHRFDGVVDILVSPFFVLEGGEGLQSIDFDNVLGDLRFQEVLQREQRNTDNLLHAARDDDTLQQLQNPAGIGGGGRERHQPDAEDGLIQQRRGGINRDTFNLVDSCYDVDYFKQFSLIQLILI